ncbi:uncharacterized protein PHALS_10201 [Plasmopara halstedii]|uniref:Uncharacterized protein n=1 Tax=Plasmopara halstedii TaxID=4781 RepID=A0A0P1AGF4_PLAHL|nr:uncharacterized protein PHALS_10201 [Plasmopara halstedii]CEG39977.1 hypothetical protein PHALS_10201 [Plasmopara halstedii]|eukprot:XP_024576346.1 hypothetical protein PHALS_10201 [Plasmopara halstedii]
MSKVYLLDKPKFRADTCVCLAFQCLVREPELTMFYEAALAHVELISMLLDLRLGFGIEKDVMKKHEQI